MSSKFLASAARALRFPSGDGACSGDESLDLHSYMAREWQRNIAALDRSGLTLPLYARLIESNGLASLPERVAEMLERRRGDNERRMAAMLQTFERAAQALRRADVRFVCLKGFSLVPEFAPQLWHRHQVDFDLLIRPEAMDRAQAALEPLGYVFTGGDRDERRLRIPVAQALGRDAYIYQLQQGAAIELHSRFWEAGGADVAIRTPDDALDCAEVHTVGGIEFLGLTAPHAFFYQVLHLFRHFLASWARPLWLYEIAAFMHRRCNDDQLWQEVHKLAAADVHTAEAMALTVLSAQNVFDAPIPSILKTICGLPADSPIALWVEHYAGRWLLADMPGNKLNLLLHRHFMADDRAWRAYLLRRLAPVGGRPNLCEGIAAKSRNGLRYRISNFRYQAERLAYHLQTGAQFAGHSIAWKKLIKPGARSFVSAALSRSES